MAEETEHRPEPEWVEELRAAGYTVRVGTGTEGLGYPKASYHDWPEPSVAFGQRVAEFVRKLFTAGASLRHRIVHR